MTAAERSFEGPLTVSWQQEPAAAGLQALQQERAVLAAEEAEYICELAELCPVDDDPPPEHPGARRRGWSPGEERPGVSEFFLDHLAVILNAGRGTASFRARRAFCWRDRLPAALARRIDAALIGQAGELSVARLGTRARELALEWDAAAAEERRTKLQAGADVFGRDKGDGITTIGADLPAEQAAEAYAPIDHLAVLAKTDGDTRPIHQLRTEISSMLLRSPGLYAGVQANLTITATLETLEGRGGAPGAVNGFVITPAQLADLLRRVKAVGLQTPENGSCTLGIVDEHGRLVATTTPENLEKRAARGEGLNPPATDAYQPTDAQRAFVTTRDRTCRWPNRGQRVGWADHDHVVAHSRGGPTSCTNLCCLCRTHHRLKTFARGWTIQLLPDGTLEVTTPSGITRVTRPPGLRPPPPAFPPDEPADDPPF